MLKNIKDKITLGALVVVGASLPLITGAQQDPDLSGITNFLSEAETIINMLVTILITLALVVFFWGLIKFIVSAGDEEGRAKGKQLMIWGIIALAVMVAIWGIIAFLINIFGLETGTGPDDPTPFQ